MRVGVEREQAARGVGGARQVVVEILPRRIAVDLDGDAARRGRGEDARPVRRDAGTRAEHAPARVAEDVDAGRGDRRQHPRRLVGGRSQHRVRRRDDDVEEPPVGRIDVDGAVGADVRFDAGEQPEGAVAVAIQPIDLGALRGEARRRQAVGDRQPAGVIGHRAPGVAVARPASTIASSVWLPSLHVECIWRSPR